MFSKHKYTPILAFKFWVSFYRALLKKYMLVLLKKSTVKTL